MYASVYPFKTTGNLWIFYVFRFKKNELLCKLRVVPIESFFKILTIVTFVHLYWPIILQNFERILWVDSENKVCKVLGPLWSKNALFLSQKLSPLFIYIPLPSCTILEKSLMWILRRRCMRSLWPNLGQKCRIWRPKRVFFSQSSPFAPLFTSNALSCCTNSKHLGPKLTHGKNDPYWANGNFFQKSELSQYCMQNFKNVPWVAGIDFLWLRLNSLL